MKPDRGIIRSQTDDGWYVKPVKKGQTPRPFFDVVYGDRTASYKQAKAFNAQLRPFKGKVRNHLNAYTGKKDPELPVGISLTTRTQINKGGQGDQLIYNFKVSCPGTTFKLKTVYIGTAWTWKGNYETALKKAKAIRADALKALSRDV